MNHTRYALPTIALATMSLTACGSDSPAKVSVTSSVASQDAAMKACTTLFGKNGVDLAKATMLGTGGKPNVTMTAGISDDPDERNHFSCTVQISGDDSTMASRYAGVYNNLTAMNSHISDIASDEEGNEGTATHVSASNNDQATGIIVSNLPPQARQQAQDKVNDLVKRLTK